VKVNDKQINYKKVPCVSKYFVRLYALWRRGLTLFLFLA
jgi:hypothetical protein